MDISQFGGRPDGTDTTPAARAALQALQGQRGARLTFSPGRYDFWGNYAHEQYLFVSNNDEGLKRLIFPLCQFEDLEIDGRGAEFIFHGFVSPFALLGCRGVKLSNFSVDWQRTFHSEAHVLDSGDGWADLYISEAFPFAVEHGRLVLTGEGQDRYALTNVLEFEPTRRETAFRVWDNYAILHGHRAEFLGPHCVRLHAEYSTVPTPGNVLALIDDQRHCPAIIVQECRDIQLENVTIHHCGGMGVIAQDSTDLTLNEVKVTPAPGRMISTSADATHFVNCRGRITLEDCRFENQLDDATNIHGIYAQVSGRPSPDEIQASLIHRQQLGMTFACPGDEIGLVNTRTLKTEAHGVVRAVDRLNKTYFRLQLEAPLPPGVDGCGYVVENLRSRPDVTIRGCVARGNRARGFLLSSAGKVLVEDNDFHTPGAAILVAGDANHWFESGAVRDLTIRGNRFDNCLYGVWGRAVIDINPEILPEHQADNSYHSGIRIENNEFRAFDNRLVRAQCVDGLTFRGNSIEVNDEYPLQPLKSGLVECDHCRNVFVEGGANT